MSTQAERTPLLDPIIDLFRQRVNDLWDACGSDASLTLAQMEARTQALGREVLGKVLSTAVQLVQEPVPEPCACGQAWRRKGRQGRRQETKVGAISWKREYYYCRHCRKGQYPLDQ
ncbi:MAG: hypothetical protein ACYC5M_15005 [Anaerolineae bacterium]